MRLLMTVHRYWPSVGGTEAFVGGLATGLARQGHDVTVATGSEPGMPAEEVREGVRILRFELVRKGKFRVPHKDYRDLIRRRDWDLWHVHGQRVWSSDYAYDLMRRTSIPLVVTFHGFYQYHMNGFRPPEWLYYHVVLPWAAKNAHVIAETENERQELIRFGVRSDRIHIISSSLDAAAFSVPHSGFRAKYGFAATEPLLLYVGGFYPNKRVEDAIRVSGKTGTKLAVIGRDPDPQERNKKEGARLARECGANVSFLGKIAWEDVLGAYQEASVLLLPSKFEGYGLVLLEAMASGLPFVASRAGAAPELAAYGCGESVETVEEMARAVDAIVADPTRRARMGAIGRSRAKEFTWERVLSDHAQVYERSKRET